MLLSVAGDKKDKIQKSCNSYLENWSLKIPSISKITYTDASTFCWGSQVRYVNRGPWFLEEKQWHINALELNAILLGLKSFKNLH